ncbi:hypothetical protein WG907_01860 [Sphingobium sp. AN558]|uniref:hypothetical protein n=1 Tax=Sphingobium sp. AN558 TaxID=3133442 RepID=UPI0030C03622
MTSMRHPRTATISVENAENAIRTPDPLPRLLTQLIARVGDPSLIVRATSRAWASALFQGRRHVILIQIGGSDALARQARFADGLAEVDWSLPRHFVADIVIDDVSRTPDGALWMELSALTIEDW